MDKKLNTVLHKNDNLEKLVKELVSKNNKVRLVCVNIPVCKFSRLQDSDQLESLLTADGLKMIKMMCFRNLDFYANDKNEVDMLTRFMNKAKDESTYERSYNSNFKQLYIQEAWLLKQSGKAEKHIKQQYRL